MRLFCFSSHCPFVAGFAQGNDVDFCALAHAILHQAGPFVGGRTFAAGLTWTCWKRPSFLGARGLEREASPAVTSGVPLLPAKATPKARSSSREFKIRVPFCSVLYFSRETLPQERHQNRNHPSAQSIRSGSPERRKEGWCQCQKQRPSHPMSQVAKGKVSSPAPKKWIPDSLVGFH